MSNGFNPTGNRPSAADAARIEGNLSYVLISEEPSDGILIFVNGKPIQNGTLESLSINIVAPTDTATSGTLTAVLSHYLTDTVTNQRTAKSLSLFPGTVELIVKGKRISISAQEAGSFEGLWLGLGMRGDGSSSEVTGARSLRVTITPDIADAKLTWSDDGTTEDIFS